MKGKKEFLSSVSHSPFDKDKVVPLSTLSDEGLVVSTSVVPLKPSLDRVMGEESFTTSSVYSRTFFTGKGAPVEAGSRVSIWVSDFSAPFEETAETCPLWIPLDPTSTSAPP